MTDRLAIALAQLNPTVGAVKANLAKARAACDEAAAQGADLILFPELFLSGYPPEDLVLQPSFVRACREAAEALARETGERGPASSCRRPSLMAGSSTMRWRCSMAARSRRCASSTICRITACSTRSGCSLPGRRRGRSISRASGSACRSARTSGRKRSARRWPRPGAELLLVPNGSPFEQNKDDVTAQSRGRAGHRDRPAARLSQPGRRAGRAGVRRRAPSRSMPTARSPCRCRCSRRRSPSPNGGAAAMAGGSRPGDIAQLPEGEEETWRACVLGPQGLCRARTGFPGVVLGLSGGIDSAVVAAMAVDALGHGAGPLRDAALCLYQPATASRMPRPAPRRSACAMTSCRSRSRSRAFYRRCKPLFNGAQPRRDRGEHPVAHARHHPDGDLQQVRLDGADHRQQIGDVGRLCHALWRHEWRLQSDQGCLQDRSLSRWPLAQRIARRTLGPEAGDPRADHHQGAQSPSCAPNQTDQDSLPPYDVLDDILTCLVEDEMPVAEIVKRGLSGSASVKRVAAHALHCRIQAAAGGARRQDHRGAISAATGAIRSPTAFATA